MKQHAGFTLIELIVVIVILGVLAATALPKFSNLSIDARIAKMNGVAAALKDVSMMAHGQALAENTPLHPGGGASSSIALEDGTVMSMYNYYPDVDVTSGVWIGITGASNVVGTEIYFTSVGGGLLGSNITFSPDKAHTTCAVTYTVAGYNAGVIAPPVIDVSALSGLTSCQ